MVMGKSAHFKLNSSLVCYFQTWHCGSTAAGATLSTVFITSPDWNWSSRLGATGSEVDLIVYGGAASAPRCHLKHRSLFMRSSLGVMLKALLFHSWRRQILIWSAPAVPASVVCLSSVIKYPFCYYIPFIMCCVTSWFLLNFLPWFESQYWHWL